MLLLVGFLMLTTPAAAESGARQVQISLVGELASEPALTERFTSWFDAEKYQVSVREQPALDSQQVLSPPLDGAVYVWVTLHHATVARLYFATAAADRPPAYSLREVLLDSGLDEVGAERLSQIVHLSTLALFEGQGEQERAQMARLLDRERPLPPPAPRAAPPPAPRAAPPPPTGAPRAAPRPSSPSPPSPVPDPPHADERAVAVEFGLGYALSPRSDEGLWHGPALHAGLRFGGALLELEGQAFLPHDEDMGTVRLRFWGVALGVGAGWRLGWGAGWSASGALGPRVEVVSYEPSLSLADEITLTEGDTELRPELGITGRVGVRGAALGAGLFVRAAYALTRTHYDLKTDTSAREIAAPSRFLPTAGLELIF
ncbi:MAG TPA: hypothetical protein VI197_02695 [Polyangiaceae bacterium]